MRRKRSETIDAENLDEYLRLSQLPKLPSKPRQRNSLPEPCLLPQSFLQNSMNLPKCNSLQNKKLKENVKAFSNNADYWDDIDFDSNEENDSGKTTPATAIGSIDSLNQESMEDEEMEQQVLPKMNVTNVMIIGMKGSGRHKLVHSLFEANSETEHQIRNSLDLVSHRLEGDSNNLFKFWIKDACCEKYQHLFKVYYNFASLLVFVYQVNNKASFKCLDQAIQEAKANFSNQEFNGILIGAMPNDFSEEQREVDDHEAEKLKMRYGLKMFIETNFNYSKENQKKFEFLIPQKKKDEMDALKC